MLRALGIALADIEGRVSEWGAISRSGLDAASAVANVTLEATYGAARPRSPFASPLLVTSTRCALVLTRYLAAVHLPTLEPTDLRLLRAEHFRGADDALSDLARELEHLWAALKAVGASGLDFVGALEPVGPDLAEHAGVLVARLVDALASDLAVKQTVFATLVDLVWRRRPLGHRRPEHEPIHAPSPALPPQRADVAAFFQTRPGPGRSADPANPVRLALRSAWRRSRTPWQHSLPHCEASSVIEGAPSGEGVRADAGSGDWLEGVRAARLSLGDDGGEDDQEVAALLPVVLSVWNLQPTLGPLPPPPSSSSSSSSSSSLSSSSSSSSSLPVEWVDAHRNQAVHLVLALASLVPDAEKRRTTIARGASGASDSTG